MEVATKEDLNPIKQDVKKGKLRYSITVVVLGAVKANVFLSDILIMAIFLSITDVFLKLGKTQMSPMRIQNLLVEFFPTFRKPSISSSGR